jgi:hypothetical protein
MDGVSKTTEKCKNDLRKLSESVNPASKRIVGEI